MSSRYFLAFLVLAFVLLDSLSEGAVRSSKRSSSLQEPLKIHKKINFVFQSNRRTPNPEGWEEYDGSIYNSVRGYGWLSDLSKEGRDRGANASILLANGRDATPESLSRLELSNWQGAHQENLPLIFRIDLPNGWYRITCTSVDPGVVMPLIDQRSFKCRAHDAVFAGPRYGIPLVVRGNQLIEGSEVVEVTDEHLRIVVGDPAYGGWIWQHSDAWYRGWAQWVSRDYYYASGWNQRLARRVDPGFHSLRLNSLEVESVVALPANASVIFRDYFNRDDHRDVNVGVSSERHWNQIKLHQDSHERDAPDLYKTSIRVTGPAAGTMILGLLQRMPSPGQGVIRYSTRVSLFSGEGSRKPVGAQEAGILLLVEPSAPGEHSGTFVGVAIDATRAGKAGSLIYRVGDGQDGYRTQLEIPDDLLAFQIREGEYELIVEHDTTQNLLRRLVVNGIDVTELFSPDARKQRLLKGMFGIRSKLGGVDRLKPQQFYWFYRVERL